MNDNLTVRFINKCRGATSFLWDFGDGTTSTDANPEKTYATGGAFVVNLTATGSLGQAYATKVAISVSALGSVVLSASAGEQLLTSSGDILAVPAP